MTISARVLCVILQVSLVFESKKKQNKTKQNKTNENKNKTKTKQNKAKRDKLINTKIINGEEKNNMRVVQFEKISIWIIRLSLLEVV